MGTGLLHGNQLAALRLDGRFHGCLPRLGDALILRASSQESQVLRTCGGG